MKLQYKGIPGLHHWQTLIQVTVSNKYNRRENSLVTVKRLWKSLQFGTYFNKVLLFWFDQRSQETLNPLHESDQQF